ncbi:MAG TPA: sensor domain-containing diguanylate cyclase [bacterium]|nr:sensor domain-containing diguanylate cyclase [bacterium]
MRKRSGGGIVQGPDKSLAFLARLASEFTTVLNLSDLLQNTMRILQEEVEFDSCIVSLIEGSSPSDALCVRGASGLRAGLLGVTLPRGKGLLWEIVKTGAPLLVNDMHRESRLSVREEHIRSGIYAPLVTGGRVIGVLSAYRDKIGAFLQADLDLLTVVARYLAGAVDVALLHERLKELAATDALTGLANRRHCLDTLDAEIARSRRMDRPMTLVLLDLNNFKVVNDAYGHVIGDAVLVDVASTLARKIRASDLLARFGGDEFVLMLPETNDVDAREILDRLQPVAIGVLGDGRRHNITFSWGTASFPQDGGNPEELLKVADDRMFAMKQVGA